MGGYQTNEKINYYKWSCFRCDYTVVKPTPQARGLARSNHLRKHGYRTINGKIRNRGKCFKNE